MYYAAGFEHAAAKFAQLKQLFRAIEAPARAVDTTRPPHPIRVVFGLLIRASLAILALYEFQGVPIGTCEPVIPPS